MIRAICFKCHCVFPVLFLLLLRVLIKSLCSYPFLTLVTHSSPFPWDWEYVLYPLPTSQFSCDTIRIVTTSFIPTSWQRSFFLACVKTDLSYLCVDWVSDECESNSSHLTLGISASESHFFREWWRNPGHIFKYTFNAAKFVISSVI